MGLGRSSHVIPAWACALAGIYGCVGLGYDLLWWGSSHVIPTQACAVVGIYGCDFVRRGCAALHRLLKVRHPYGVPLSPVGTKDDRQAVLTPADKKGLCR